MIESRPTSFAPIYLFTGSPLRIRILIVLQLVLNFSSLPLRLARHLLCFALGYGRGTVCGQVGEGETGLATNAIAGIWQQMALNQLTD